MQSHDPIQLEKDSSHPIVIPGAQEIIKKTTDAINIEATAEISAPSTSEGSTQFAPDSFQTARSFKNSPTEYPFSTSHSSITNNNNSQFISAFGSLRNSINTSPTTNFSPRLEGPLTGSISGHRNSITERANSGSLLQQQQQQQQQQDTAGRRNILNSKFTPSSFQIPSYQQLHQQSTQFQQNHNGLSSSFVPNRPNQPPQPNLTSSHFQTNTSSYTPYHNAPNTVSSSYSSANNSYQNNSFHSYAEQHSFNQPPSSTATTALRTERGGFDNLPSSRNGVEEQQQEQQQVDADNDTDMVDAPSDNSSNNNKRTTTESLLTSSLASITANDTAVEDSSSITTHSKGDETLESVHLDIVNHPTEDLLIMLAALLQKIIEANDNLHPNHYTHAPHNQEGDSAHQLSNQQHPENKFIANVLAFHGRNVPAISIQAYLSRILKYCPVTNEVFLTLLVYFDRIAKRANAGDFNTTPVKSEEEGHINDTPEAEHEKKDQLFVMDSYNIHRLIIAGVTVASKFFSDIFYKNSRYAKVGGLPLEELNHLEIQFLLLTDFKLLIQTEELQRYADLLLKFWAREQEKSS
ncbi:hypothetical protein WICPIJ_000564 [Wickerhamomyces pijperi]|uniref:Cyclin n=1 Tax=Wickerhamomyces pijperi TaxID=599730 RepID=A0A9P8QFT9_WICPI|nr:hypothetical protein WICPIJ_000564 [Wickerhamomyces pijperi]